MSSWQESPMNRTWNVCRQFSPRRDAERRRDQAYQLLVRWAGQGGLPDVMLIQELAGHGCQVEFLDRPMSSDPHDQLLLQIRGAVAEYERTLITERMRRGRQARLRAGTLLPWTTPPFGYRLDPDRPRQASAVRVEPGEAVLVAQLFDWYLQPQATVYRLARPLTDLGVATPTGKPRRKAARGRRLLPNPAYTRPALTN